MTAVLLVTLIFVMFGVYVPWQLWKMRRFETQDAVYHKDHGII